MGQLWRQTPSGHRLFLVNAVPENPSIDALSLDQFNGAPQIAVGGRTGGASAASRRDVQGRVSDPDPGDVLVIEASPSRRMRHSTVTSGLFARYPASRPRDRVGRGVNFTAPLLGSTKLSLAARARATRRGAAAPGRRFGGNSDVVTAATDFHVP